MNIIASTSQFHPKRKVRAQDRALQTIEDAHEKLSIVLMEQRTFRPSIEQQKLCKTLDQICLLFQVAYSQASELLDETPINLGKSKLDG